MNRITRQTPLNEALELLARDGYVLLEDALSPQQLGELNHAYDQQLALHPRPEGALRVEVPRLIERDTAFEQLMDNAPVFDIARGALGYDIELASGGELDHKFARTPAYIGWHSDFQWMTNVPLPRANFWIRATYFLGDVREDTGPFTLLPGTHTRSEPCPETPGGQQPAHTQGQLGITGRAGSCLINNTEIWHTNSPLTGDFDRRLIMIMYKHAWMKPWQDGYDISPEFAARQSDPVRRQLCGLVPWHQSADNFPVHQRDVVATEAAAT